MKMMTPNEHMTTNGHTKMVQHSLDNNITSQGHMMSGHMTAKSDVKKEADIGNGVDNNNVKQCAGCGTNIFDRFLLHAVDRYWHTGCLKCTHCQAQLGDIGQTCFTKNSMILCRNDYIRLFGTSGSCSGCSQPIPAQEMVMRAQNTVYHVGCFKCVICHCKLMRGDRYTIYQGSLLCEHDFPKVVRGVISLPATPTRNKVC